MKLITLMTALSLSFATSAAFAGKDCPQKAKPGILQNTNGQQIVQTEAIDPAAVRAVIQGKTR